MTYLGTVAAATGWPYVPTAFLFNWHQMLCHAERALGGNIFAPRIIGSQCYDQRNTAALQMEGDWLLTLDVDQEYPENHILDMVASQRAIAEEHGSCDVLTGIVCLRFPPYEPSLWRFDEEAENWEAIVELGSEDYPLDRPWQCDGAGGGCLLIQASLIERIVWELGVPPFAPIGPITKRDASPRIRGADFWFARRCHELGVRFWCDPTIQATHYADPRPITLADWFANQEAVLEDSLGSAAKGRAL